MLHLFLIPAIAVTVSLTVWAQFRHDDRQVYLWKPLSTVLVIAIALLSLPQPEARPAFTWWVTAGLVLSLGGDVALMFKSSRAFLVGLVLFLLAHIAYAAGFTLFNGFHPQDLVTAVALLIIAVPIYLYLRPGLGRMHTPVVLYILVILVMVHRALSTFFGDTFTTTQAWLLSLGAILFLLSDLILAVDRFRHPFELGRLRLHLYYAGQILIALSTHYFAG
ncbi:MAG TPA: lysoplasmalogenase [Anaerolineae bacterium]|nr:lysoplasmalogenase [Anaerolineae bacterium]